MNRSARLPAPVALTLIVPVAVLVMRVSVMIVNAFGFELARLVDTVSVPELMMSWLGALLKMPTELEPPLTVSVPLLLTDPDAARMPMARPAPVSVTVMLPALRMLPVVPLTVSMPKRLIAPPPDWVADIAPLL